MKSSIAIADVRIGRRRRTLGDVGQLANSIAEIGLLQPIVVTKDRRLVAGRHRLLACKQLGWTEIPAVVLSLDDMHRRVAEIDENLVRNELTALERAEHLAERKRLYEAQHPETKRGASGGGRNGKGTRSKTRLPDSGKPVPRFTADVEAKTGRAESKVREEIALAEALPRDVRDTLRSSPVADNKEELKRLAKLEHDEQRAVATAIATGVARGVREARRAQVIQSIEAEPAAEPTGPFRVIVADPPWPYEKRNDDHSHRAALPYPSMTLDDIRAMPLAERAHADAVLWLWTTNAFMRDAFTVVDAWGFREKTILTWVKPTMGVGDWLRGQTEHCILAVRGGPVVNLTNQTTALIAQAREHSRKPDEFYALVEQLCPGNKLELFARQKREGWTAWGAEAEAFGAEGDLT